ncbi:MAG: type II secretion system F family protein [Planctomycetota bacterium]
MISVVAPPLAAVPSGVIALLVFVGLPSVGIALRMLLRLVYGARGPGANAPLHTFLSVVSLIFIAIGFLLVLFPAAVGVLGPLQLIAIYALVEWRLARRDLQRRSVWSLITRCQQRGRALAPMLELNQQRFTGHVGRAYRQMLRFLTHGDALPIALAAAPRAAPRDALAAATLAGESPVPTDPRLAGDQSLGMQGEWLRLTYGLGYLVTVVSVGALLLTGVMLYIVPSFRQIFEEFELDLPSMTVTLVDLAGVTGGTLGSLIVMFALCVVLFALITLVLYAFDIPVLRGLTDRLLWFRHRAAVLLLLAEAAERGMTFAGAIDRLANHAPGYASGLVRRRLRRAYAELTAGQHWVDSLRKARLIRLCDTSALEAARGAGNLPWVLRRIADENLTHGLFRLKLCEKIVLPTLIVLLAAAVGFVVVALFLPLVALIENMS